MSPAIWRPRWPACPTPPHASGAETAAGRHGSSPAGARLRAMGRHQDRDRPEGHAADLLAPGGGNRKRSMNLASSNAWSCRITMAGSARRGLPRAITRDSGAKVTFLCTEQRYPTSYLRMGAISDGASLRAFQSAEAAAAAVPDRCERLARAAGVACPPSPWGRRALRGHHRGRHPDRRRRDPHGLSRLSRRQGAAAGQRDPEGADPLDDPGARLPLNTCARPPRFAAAMRSTGHNGK